MTLLIVILLVIAALVLLVIFYTRQAKFGKAPHGARLQAITQSPAFRDGEFQNISLTPTLAEGFTWGRVLYAQLFKKAPRKKPASPLPSVKTDLLQLLRSQDVLVWFGHSSYFMQVDGMRILVDPVFSGNASPIPGTNRSFEGTDIYTADDLPPIDYLFITHDHYDHLDYETVLRLKNKTRKIICGLGVGSHLEYWGFDPSAITELDWYGHVQPDDGFDVHVMPSRHFSGRGFKRNNTLWVSFVLLTPAVKLYLGGDSGYDKHFKEIGERFGPFDLALLDNGQYNLAWQYIHALPTEVLQAAKDLQARRLFPVHSGKFSMANHAWYEPLKEITALCAASGVHAITPMIGEVVRLKDEGQAFRKWWEGID